ncbi:MAG: L-ribulose-5-phosphate 4-epimerase AraD [Terrimicrobiaceae bacterium]
MSRFDAIREECCAANAALSAAGLVDLTFGNASVCDREAGVFAIKPSGVRYDRLNPGEMVIVDMGGKIVEGALRPSSDTPTHRRLFLAFARVRSVVHTHSRHAVSFAQAGREIPLLGTTHADYFRGAVPVTRALTPQEIESGYEWETGNVIVERFSSLDPSEMQAVLVRNHGPFTWGDTGEKAVENAVALEIVAQMALQALSLDPLAPAPAAELADKHFLRKHGPSAYYGQ